jgi:hypothetical protein
MKNILDIETFIFIHNQEILLEFEKNNKFKNFCNYKYVFLGYGETNKLNYLNNIIYARDLPNNLEKYDKMCAYSGWYVLYMNELISSEYVNLFEYDISITDDFIDKLGEIINENSNIYSYVPFDIRVEFLNPKWIGDLSKFYKVKKKIDLVPELMKKINEKNISHWASTSNITFNSDFFFDYMNDVAEIFEWMKIWGSVGHALERLLSFYLILNNINNITYVNGLLHHYQLDSHKTQLHFTDLNNNLKKIANNE